MNVFGYFFDVWWMRVVLDGFLVGVWCIGLGWMFFVCLVLECFCIV